LRCGQWERADGAFLGAGARCCRTGRAQRRNIPGQRVAIGRACCGIRVFALVVTCCDAATSPGALRYSLQAMSALIDAEPGESDAFRSLPGESPRSPHGGGWPRPGPVQPERRNITGERVPARSLCSGHITFAQIEGCSAGGTLPGALRKLGGPARVVSRLCGQGDERSVGTPPAQLAAARTATPRHCRPARRGRWDLSRCLDVSAGSWVSQCRDSRRGVALHIGHLPGPRSPGEGFMGAASARRWR
jgi:hypothetical protein